MKKIILMDMDGTLTEPRKPMAHTFSKVLDEIFNSGFHVGIVSGSPLEYIEEQMGYWINQFRLDEKLHIFPCNGMQYIHQGQEIYSKNMIKNLTKEIYLQIIRIISETSVKFQWEWGASIIPTGTFIQYRGSMINFCPIGRNSTQQQRQKFCELDKKWKIREKILLSFKSNPVMIENLTIKLGGETSFDIYPKGWDKSYAFKNFRDFEEIHFIGDRCDSMGNDHEAYIKAGNDGHITTGPTCTARIITKILSR